MKAFIKYLLFAAAMTLISGEVGAILGGVAEMLYNGSSLGRQVIGWSVGLCSGLLSGALYCSFLIRRHKAAKPLLEFGVYAGIAAGLLCSMIVHTVLLIVFGGYPLVMLIGIPFGAAAGTSLGLFSVFVINVCCGNQSAAEEPTHASA